MQEPSMTPSDQIAKKIADYPDWRGNLLTRIRRLVLAADPKIEEDIKWRGAPTWSHNGLVCVANIFKDTVKVVFARGARLADPKGIFNSELAGNAWRGITFSENDTINEAAFIKLIRSAVEFNSANSTKKRSSRSIPPTNKGHRK
jgi:hypothetical protein